MKNIVVFSLALSLFLTVACGITTPTPVSNGINVPTPSTSGVESAPTQPPSPPTAVPSPAPTMQASMTAVFDPTRSGSICPKRSPELELGGPPPIIGEVDDTWRCEGYWTFDISQLPHNAQILSATFTPGSCSREAGDPFAFGPMSFGHVSIGYIDVADYGGSADGSTEYDVCPQTLDISSFLRGSYKGDSVQIVSSFELSDYGNGTGDYVSYTGTEPILTIEYSYTP